MSARSVCSGTRPSRYHSVRAISMPFRRPGAHDLDALRAQAHRVLHRALHRAAEHDALLELLRDRVGDQLRIDLGLADFLDVDVHRHAQQLLQLGLQALDVLALLADHHARARREDRDARVLRRDARSATRDDRGVLRACFFRNSRTLMSSASMAAKFWLFAYQREAQLRVTARRKPVGWIFCPMVSLPSVADGDVDVAGGLA